MSAWKIIIGYDDVFRVVDGDDDSGGQFNLVEDGLRVDQVEALLSLAFHVRFHVVVQILCSNVAVRCQNTQNVFLLGGEVAHQLLSLRF